MRKVSLVLIALVGASCAPRLQYTQSPQTIAPPTEEAATPASTEASDGAESSELAELASRFAEVENSEAAWLASGGPQSGRTRVTYYGLGEAYNFHGKCAAAGVVFSRYSITAASNAYPLGTIIRMTRGSRSLDVVVADTGAFGHLFDVAYGVLAYLMERGELDEANLRITNTGDRKIAEGRANVDFEVIGRVKRSEISERTKLPRCK